MFLEKGVAAFPDVAAAVSEGRSLRQGKGGDKGETREQFNKKTNTKQRHANIETQKMHTKIQ